MARDKPAAFTRDEWAYLIGFLDPGSLRSAFSMSFGEPDPSGAPADAVAVPGGTIAVWLPNNVSLLGALSLVLLTLTGNAIRIKSGSRGDDLTRAFLDYAVAHLAAGPLRDLLETRVDAQTFARDDARNAEWAAEARTRIAFGSDEAVAAIDALPHPPGSASFSFGHRESEAWIDLAGSGDDAALVSLLKVFDVYGLAACTSPARVILLDASREDALALRDRLVERWASLFPRAPEMAIASAAVLDHQWAGAQGWDSRLTARHGAALAVGAPGIPMPEGRRLLRILSLSLEEALSSLPRNIQTVGQAISPSFSKDLPRRLAAEGVKRFVPIRDMHQFGPVWDGQSFWQSTFDRMEAAG